MKKNFEDCLSLIQSEKIRRFVQKALDAAPPEFFKAPCSSSGQYHPPEDQVEGGIIVHSRKAVRVALDLFRFFDVKDQLAKDKIIAACILHDIQKNGIPWSDKTSYEHGPIAAKWLFPFAVLEPEAKDEDFVHLDGDLVDILELVKNHMGIWNQPNKTSALKLGKDVEERDVWHLIVQLSDYWASRKWCPFVADELGDR